MHDFCNKRAIHSRSHSVAWNSVLFLKHKKYSMVMHIQLPVFVNRIKNAEKAATLTWRDPLERVFIARQRSSIDAFASSRWETLSVISQTLEQLLFWTPASMELQVLGALHDRKIFSGFTKKLRACSAESFLRGADMTFGRAANIENRWERTGTTFHLDGNILQIHL